MSSGDPIDLTLPPNFGPRTITAIHLHHDGGGDELDDPHEIERDALSRVDQRFAQIPYHVVVFRPTSAADALAVPLEANPWLAAEGRPLRLDPASVRGQNAGAVAIVVAGRWDREPLPAWAYERLIEVCVWVCRAAGLTAEAIHGHRELAPTLCPGYDVARVRAGVEAALCG